MKRETDPRQEWETPTAAHTAHWKRPMPFFDVVDEEFSFQIDVCATRANSKCAEYIGPVDEENSSACMIDALYEKTPWFPGGIARAWCNPGFGDLRPWAEKAYEQTQSNPGTVVVVMAIISSSVKWWRDWAMKADEIRLIGGRRLQFIPAPGVKASSNMRENCLL